ncbi:hypothetical protein BGZ52_009987 [Haplosporangium bisporale]|nr:hypothetical protein BGZ52_009987 [Haplosporangium bisporale]KAF9200685.1 hypothetical protein BGZ59_003143 [Podila verticillata]
MASASIENVEAALSEFRQQRYDNVKIQYESSKTKAKITYGQAWHERLMRHVVFSYMPKSMMEKTLAKDGEYRPQVSFLPLAPPRGKGPFFQQKPSAKYLKLEAEKAEKAKAERVASEESAASETAK